MLALEGLETSDLSEQTKRQEEWVMRPKILSGECWPLSIHYHPGPSQLPQVIWGNPLHPVLGVG